METVTLYVDLGECGEKQVEFDVDCSPAQKASGLFGKWENATPGYDAECYITAARINDKDVLWLFDAEGLKSLAQEILDELNTREPEFNEPELFDRRAA